MQNDALEHAGVEVQKEILKAIASRPEAAQKLEEAIEVRWTQVHDRDYGLGL